MTQHHTPALTVAAAIAAAIIPAAALADHGKQHDSHRQLREAVQRGQVLPLTRILAIAQARAPGDVIKVELDDDDDYGGRLIYEVKTLSASGRVMKVEIDAATGKVLKTKED